MLGVAGAEYRRLTSATDPAMSASRTLTSRSARRLKYRQDLTHLVSPELGQEVDLLGFSAEVDDELLAADCEARETCVA
jgi:hypothetical protein